MSKIDEMDNKENIEENSSECSIDGIDHQARSKDAEDIVTKHMLFAVGFGTVPVPIVDIVGLTATQLNMLRKLSEAYGESFTDELAKKAIASLVGGSLTIPVAMSVASLIKSLPIIGQTAGAVSIASVGAASTYAVGQVFIRHFESGGTLISFDSDTAREFFKDEFEKGKKLVKTLTKSKKNQEEPKEDKQEEQTEEKAETKDSK
ncbi:MAG: DUF697 domain-containing protein [Campylobacterota bacterium]|nr:DUF697 domain-containing protein [Campylobacterota bacterium]